MSEMTHPSGYEKKDIPVGKVAAFALAGVLFLAAVGILGRSFFILSKERTYRTQVMETPAPYLDEVNVKARKRLHSYGVLDAEKGLYHIPIEVAMQKLAESSSE